MRPRLALILSTGLTSGVVVMSPAVAGAEAPEPKMCTYVTTGSGAGELSRILCQRYGIDSWTDIEIAAWDDPGMTLADPINGEILIGLDQVDEVIYPKDDSSWTNYSFAFDTSQLTFTEAKQELQEQFGFTHVRVGMASWQIWADYEVPSKAKH